MKKLKGFIADILVKTFQIVFGMLVVGMALRDRFDPLIFALGLSLSAVVLTAAIQLYYNANVGEEK